jgi:hypothetical protein
MHTNIYKELKGTVIPVSFREQYVTFMRECLSQIGMMTNLFSGIGVDVPVGELLETKRFFKDYRKCLKRENGDGAQIYLIE